MVDREVLEGSLAMAKTFTKSSSVVASGGEHKGMISVGALHRERWWWKQLVERWS